MYNDGVWLSGGNRARFPDKYKFTRARLYDGRVDTSVNFSLITGREVSRQTKGAWYRAPQYSVEFTGRRVPPSLLCLPPPLLRRYDFITGRGCTSKAREVVRARSFLVRASVRRADYRRERE